MVLGPWLVLPGSDTAGSLELGRVQSHQTVPRSCGVKWRCQQTPHLSCSAYSWKVLTLDPHRPIAAQLDFPIPFKSDQIPLPTPKALPIDSEKKWDLYTIHRLHLQDLHPQIQPTVERKWSKEIASIPSMYRLFLVIFLHNTAYHYLSSTSIVLGV
jgi:hypothetical protein